MPITFRESLGRIRASLPMHIRYRSDYVIVTPEGVSRSSNRFTLTQWRARTHDLTSELTRLGLRNVTFRDNVRAFFRNLQ